MSRIGFIGTGEIAAAMVAGLAGQGHDLILSRRNAQMAADLVARYGDVRLGDNAEVVQQADIVVLCLMASVARQILPELPFRAGQQVISVMVDVDFAALQDLCAPTTDITITIPMPSIARGGAPLPVFPADSRSVADLFGAINPIIPCRDEAALQAYFGGSALASPILDMMRVGAGWLAEQTGDRRAAEAYVAGLFAGFMRDVAEDQTQSFQDALHSLSTEGGLNASLRDHMRAAKADEALRTGLDQLKPRLGLTT
jgi:pyrroline-5-carboxylate reductase